MLIFEDRNGNRVECVGDVRIASLQTLYPRGLYVSEEIRFDPDRIAKSVETHAPTRSGVRVTGLRFPICTEGWERGRTLALIKAGLERSVFEERWFLEREAALETERKRLGDELLERLAA